MAVNTHSHSSRCSPEAALSCRRPSFVCLFIYTSIPSLHSLFCSLSLSLFFPLSHCHCFLLSLRLYRDLSLFLSLSAQLFMPVHAPAVILTDAKSLPRFGVMKFSSREPLKGSLALSRSCSLSLSLACPPSSRGQWYPECSRTVPCPPPPSTISLQITERIRASGLLYFSWTGG